MSGSGSSMYYLVDTRHGGRAEEYLRIIKEHTSYHCIIVKNNRW
jgi:hypothetical protein